MQNRNALLAFFIIALLLIAGIFITNTKSNSTNLAQSKQTTIISPLPSTPSQAPTITSTTTLSPAQSENSFILSAQNNSGESGKVLLSEQNGKVLVTIDVTPLLKLHSLLISTQEVVLTQEQLFFH